MLQHFKEIKGGWIVEWLWIFEANTFEERVVV